MKRQHISQERLIELLIYDPETGAFTWRTQFNNCVKKGSLAGTLCTSGYVLICLDGRRYKAHRLAWLYVYGRFPSKDIDHINRVRSDNRILNLREASDHQNGQNRSINKNNKSGFKGVCWHKATGKWQASIRVNYKTIHLGLFDTIELAAKARKEAEALHFTFVHTESVGAGV